jgi:hypothetical protein
MKRVVAAMGAALAMAAVARADLRYGVSAGIAHSNNIERVEEGETSESIGIIGFDLDWDEQSRRLEGNTAIDLAYNEYLDDTFDSEVTGTAEGALLVKIVPETLDWNFGDSFGQAQSDPFSPSTPETRENVNYFTTGPELRVRLGSMAQLKLLGQYSLVDYENSALDGSRRTYGLAFVRRPSQASELSLNGVVDQVLFDDQPDSDYERRSAFLGYEIEGGRTELTANLGYSEIEFGTGGDSEGGLLASLQVSREISAASTLDLRVGQQFMDAADALRNYAGGEFGGSGAASGIAATSEPFENREFSAIYRWARRRTEMTLAASVNQNRYIQDDSLDRDRNVYSFNISRQVGARFNLGLVTSLTDEEFLAIDDGSQELNYGVVANLSIGATVSLRLTLDHFERSTDSGLGEYDEDRAWLSLRWQRGGGP